MTTPVLLKNLHCSSDMWSITVRVMRRWNIYQKISPNEVFCISLLLVDAEGTRIQATINHKPDFDKWNREVILGNVYEFEHFQVSLNTQSYRATTHPYRLKFTSKTSFYEEQAPIPKLVFSFMPIADINALTDVKSVNYLIDVIGFVKQMGSLEHPNKENGPKDILKMILSDTEDNEIECVLYDPCAFDASMDYMEDDTKSFVAVINLCKITTTLDGKPQISSSYDATKVFFNPDINEVNALLARAEEKSTPMTTQFSQTILSQKSSMSREADSQNLIIIPLASINQQKMGDTFVVQCELKKFESMYDWRYVSCAKCKSKPKLSDTSNTNSPLYCANCQRTPEKLQTRLRLTYTVEDGTASALVTFWDNVASQLVNKTLSELEESLPQRKRATAFPAGLEDSIGKRFVLHLRLSKYNMENPGSSISVCEFSRCQDLLNDFNAVASENIKHTSHSVEYQVTSQGSNASKIISENEPTVDLSSEDIPLSYITPASSQTSAKSKKRGSTTVTRACSSSNTAQVGQNIRSEPKILRAVKQEK